MCKFSHQSSNRHTLLRLNGQHVIQNLYCSVYQSEIFPVPLNLEQWTIWSFFSSDKVTLSLLSFWTHRICWVFERHKTVISNGFKLLGKKRRNDMLQKLSTNSEIHCRDAHSDKTVHYCILLTLSDTSLAIFVNIQSMLFFMFSSIEQKTLSNILCVCGYLCAWSSWLCRSDVSIFHLWTVYWVHEGFLKWPKLKLLKSNAHFLQRGVIF